MLFISQFRRRTSECDTRTTLRPFRTDVVVTRDTPTRTSRSCCRQPVKLVQLPSRQANRSRSSANDAEGRLRDPTRNGTVIARHDMPSVRDARRQLGLSQQALAMLIGASTESVRTWDSGRRRVPALFHARIAQALRRRDIGDAKALTASEAPMLVVAPDNFDDRVVALRWRLHLTQAALASAVGAAGKAVVYQWESRKRRPSPAFWARIERLERTIEH